MIPSQTWGYVGICAGEATKEVEEALSAADEGDISKFLSLCEVIKKPYTEDVNFEEFTKPAPASDRVYKTYCGT